MSKKGMEQLASQVNALTAEIAELKEKLAKYESLSEATVKASEVDEFVEARMPSDEDEEELEDDE
jgi:predicted translin family RNA/ssDNA-binding protein